MTDLDAARALLPFWVVWGPLLLFLPLAFLLSLAATWAGVRLSFRQPRAEAFWTEQARLVYPGRVVALRASLLCPFLCGAFPLVVGGLLCPVPPVLVGLLAALLAYLGSVMVRYRLERNFHPLTPGLWNWVRGEAFLWLVFYSWLVVLGITAACLYGGSGLSPWIVLGLGGSLLAFLGCGGGLFLCRPLGLARRPSPRLQTLVEQTAGRLGVRPPPTCELDMNAANAVAFPLLGWLGFSPALLAALDDEEVRVVCAHELGHLQEPRLLALTRTLPLVFMLPVVGCGPLLEAFGLTGFLVPACLALLSLMLAQPLSRILERRADRLAQEQEGEAGAYARALGRIAEANLAPVVGVGRGGSHPHLYDRMVAAGVHPEYARPRPPSGLRLGLAALLAISFLPLAGWVAGEMAAPDSEAFLLACLALGGGQPHDLGNLAGARARRGDLEGAIIFLRAQGQADPQSALAPADLALRLVAAGRCREARAAAVEARRRAARKPNPHQEDYVRLAWRRAFECEDVRGEGRAAENR